MMDGHQGPMKGWVELLSSVSLDDVSSKIAVQRIALQCEMITVRVGRLSRCYRFMKVIVTGTALLVPAVSGLDVSQGSSAVVFWVVWSLSLTTALSNGLISLFSLDRKYFEMKEKLKRLERESWLFISGAGKYKEKSRQEMFPIFLENCEHVMEKFSDHSRYHLASGEAPAEQPLSMTSS